MNFDSSRYEGDYCFLLPERTQARSTHNPEKKIKTRSQKVTRLRSPKPALAEHLPTTLADAGDRERMIAEAAYFRAEQRGFAPGNEMSDWLLAEVDIAAKF